MGTEAEEIEQRLNSGLAILNAHSEFLNMPLDKVIDSLDDGTEQMIGDRWGVAAWIVIKGLQSYDICELIEPLAQVKSGPLTYEYVGYLLQNDYGVNLETLIIEADRQQMFGEIVKYASPNLPYEKTVYKENICPLMDLFERHIHEQECDTLISCYATHITNMHSQSLLLDTIGELSRVAEYQVVCRIQGEWYRADKTEAITYIDKLIAYRSIWSKKAALRFLDISVFSERETFQSRFSEVEKMIEAEGELWKEAIPAFTHYIEKYSNEKSTDICYDKVLGHLKRISSGDISTKCTFLESIRFNSELEPALQTLYLEIAGSPAEKNQYYLQLIAEVLYFPVHNGKWRCAVDIMKSTFCANGYLEDYYSFFSAMNMIAGVMKKHSAEISKEALKYILSDDAFHVFFGLGLLLNIGNLMQISSGDSNTLSEAQLIHVMTGILYYAFDAKKICLSAFELLRLGDGSNNGYVEFCMISVYGNYPETFSSTAKKYEEAENLLQKQLAERVLENHKVITERRKLAYSIKDVKPSAKHEFIYRRALAEHNKQINKNADEKSLLNHLFSKRFLKFGVRSAFLSSGRNGDMNMRISPYKTFSYEVEFPVKYIEDPVDYLLKRQRYLKELKTECA